MPTGGAPREFHYRLQQNASGNFPGAHPSTQGESGMAFRNHRPLAAGGDPRRLDIQASLRDPLGQWWVRVNAERMAVPVTLVADLSGSMAFEGERRRADVLADFTESLAWSAHRHGDTFAFVGADEALAAQWQWPPTRQRGAGAHLAAALRRATFAGPGHGGAGGLRLAHRHLGRQRGLVFLASDFHWPAGLLAEVMASLAGHEVVPVVLWDRAEFRLPARDGLAWLADSEGRGQHLLWLRPALRRQWAERLAPAQQALREAFQPWRARPLFLLDGFDGDAVSAHFHA